MSAPAKVMIDLTLSSSDDERHPVPRRLPKAQRTTTVPATPAQDDVPARFAVPDAGIFRGSDFEAHLTLDACVNRVKEVFPDISEEYVTEMLQPWRSLVLVPESACLAAIHTIAQDTKYPTERLRQEQLKRKRDEDEDEDRRILEDRNESYLGHDYYHEAYRTLKEEFPRVPKDFIKQILKKDQKFCLAFATLDAAEKDYVEGQSPFERIEDWIAGTMVGRSTRGKPAKPAKPVTAKRAAAAQQVERELGASRRAKAQQDRKREEDAKTTLREKKNEEAAQAAGTLTECGCCFADVPRNRCIQCTGADMHLFCYTCIRQLVENLIGQGKCSLTCMDTSGCKARFTDSQLKKVLDERSFQKLGQLQQDEDIRLAGLDDLEECPFCDFKAIMPSIQEDKEFRCQAPKCKKVSCRLCHKESHVPLTCKQVQRKLKKDDKLNKRHVVEEAMTEALIRSCNKCKNKFVKLDGCNKMTCPRCRNVQCYICSKNVKSYDHFSGPSSRPAPGTCPMQDDTGLRHEDEVRKAGEKASKKLRDENPDLAEEDLKIQVTDKVKADDRLEAERNARNLAMVLDPRLDPRLNPMAGRRPHLDAPPRLPAMPLPRPHAPAQAAGQRPPWGPEGVAWLPPELPIPDDRRGHQNLGAMHGPYQAGPGVLQPPGLVMGPVMARPQIPPPLGMGQQIGGLPLHRPLIDQAPHLPHHRAFFEAGVPFPVPPGPQAQMFPPIMGDGPLNWLGDPRFDGLHLQPVRPPPFNPNQHGIHPGNLLGNRQAYGRHMRLHQYPEYQYRPRF